MKKTLVLLTVVFTVLVGFTAKAQQAILGQMQPGDGSFAVVYTNYYGHAVLFEFEATKKRISIKVNNPGKRVVDDDTLAFLKGEVTRFISSTNTIKVADGYSFKYEGGYPIWAPYNVFSKSGDYQCLLFAREASVSSNKVIVARGDTQISGWYPEGYGIARKE